MSEKICYGTNLSDLPTFSVDLSPFALVCICRSGWLWVYALPHFDHTSATLFIIMLQFVLFGFSSFKVFRGIDFSEEATCLLHFTFFQGKYL